MTNTNTLTPQEAREYRTARFNSVVLAVQPTLPRERIYLRFMNYIWNKHKGRREVIFMCYRTTEFSYESFIGCYYENALEDFAK